MRLNKIFLYFLLNFWHIWWWFFKMERSARQRHCIQNFEEAFQIRQKYWGEKLRAIFRVDYWYPKSSLNKTTFEMLLLLVILALKCIHYSTMKRCWHPVVVWFKIGLDQRQKFRTLNLVNSNPNTCSQIRSNTNPI